MGDSLNQQEHHKNFLNYLGKHRQLLGVWLIHVAWKWDQCSSKLDLTQPKVAWNILLMWARRKKIVPRIFFSTPWSLPHHWFCSQASYQTTFINIASMHHWYKDGFYALSITTIVSLFTLNISKASKRTLWMYFE